jgi:hypothetical protein
MFSFSRYAANEVSQVNENLRAKRASVASVGWVERERNEVAERSTHQTGVKTNIKNGGVCSFL